MHDYLSIGEEMGINVSKIGFTQHLLFMMTSDCKDMCKLHE